MATLIVMSGPGVDNYYPLGRRTTVVGRDEGVPIQILDPHVSRKHFQVTYNPETELYYVLDMRSRHGTLVCGERISADKVKPLCNNDILTAGGTTILFTTKDFPDAKSALAYRKQVGPREETTYVK